MKIKSAGPIDTRAGSGIYVDVGGITGISMEEEGGSVEEERPLVSSAEVEGALDLFPLVFPGPLKVTIGSSRFKQFFLM